MGNYLAILASLSGQCNNLNQGSIRLDKFFIFLALLVFRKFLTAVIIHVLAWEAIFLTLGALGGEALGFFKLQFRPFLLLIWMAIMITAEAGLGYFVLRRARSRGQL
jgi:membrane protein DedA with SNARE-associated domain